MPDTGANIIAARMLDTSPRGYQRAQAAWTAFWQEPGQSRCVAGATDIWDILTRHWSAFAQKLPPGARALDLGCGAGAVPHALSAARRDLHVTGVDFARIPLVMHGQVDLLSDTAMEALPFADESFNAAVSQFGYEYSRTDDTAKELARALAPGAAISFLVHHAASSIVAANTARLHALAGILAQPLRAAFCAGDAVAFATAIDALKARHPHDTVLAELAHALPPRLARAPRERVAIWSAVEDALGPEHCIAQALDAACVAPERLDAWLAPLRRACNLEPPGVLREENGRPIAWIIAGRLG